MTDDPTWTPPEDEPKNAEKPRTLTLKKKNKEDIIEELKPDPEEQVALDEAETPETADDYVEVVDSDDKSDDMFLDEESARASQTITKEVTIRRAQALDVCNIGKLLKKAKKRHYGDLLGDENDAKSVARILELTTNHLVYIAERGGSILGVIGVWIEQWAYGDDIQLDLDFVEFAHKSWRDRGLGLKLIETIESIADHYGLRFNLTVHSSIKPEAKGRYFEMRGYRYMGSVYLRQPNNGKEEPEADDEHQE